MQYLVSRHSGAVEWLKRNGFAQAQVIQHLDIDLLKQQDIVIGNLPVTMIADINAKGVRYFNLNLNLSPELRGVEITADKMDELGASVQEFVVKAV